MPTYSVQAPSGKTYTVEGPEGATADQLGQFILAQSKEERAALQMQQDRETYSPTNGMGTMERLAAGIGKGMTDLARGAGQWVGAVDRNDVAEARKLDAPLMSTTAGKVGSFVGKAVPIAASSVLIPGAGTLVGSTAIGAASGALEPSTGTRETLKNIAVGGGAGAVGNKVGGFIADKLAQRAADKAAQFATQQTANAQRVGAARAASAEGYVIPPSDVQPQGALMEALGGLSGKVKTAQAASAKNQQVTDALARKAVGLSPQDALTADVLKGVRQQAGQVYDQVRGVGQVRGGPEYDKALDALETQFRGAEKSFPGLTSDEVRNAITPLRQPSFDAGDAVDATRVLRGLADDAFASGNKTLARAYRGASDALESALERHLQATAPEMMPAFREARQLIAKTYSVEKALNGQTGEVSAQALAQQLARGKPLSGDLRTIAEAGQAFPKATQMLKEAPKAVSPLDWMAAMGTGAMTQNPLALLALGARPAARSVLLSPAVQRNALRDLAAPSGAVADLASNPLTRLLYGPVGAAAGTTAVNAKQQKAAQP